MMYSFDEIGLIPGIVSTVKHRGNTNPFTGENKLPLFVSPMTCILNKENIGLFENSEVIPILPVTPDLDARFEYRGWKAFSIVEVEHGLKNNLFLDTDKILIDCANGHMEYLFELVAKLKDKWPNITVMSGNIANPNTYLEYCKAKIDYVRVGIGGGSGCTTSVYTGFHASLPWLLEEIQSIKLKHKHLYPTKIVADGGISAVSKAIKALALGADYVMMGRYFAESEEACGKKVSENERMYYGQSSRSGQIDRFGEVKSIPEGIEYPIKIAHPLSYLTEKIKSYLRSAMSYAGAQNLEEFVGKVEYNLMSPIEFQSFIK